MTVSECLILNLHLILEETHQLVLGLSREFCNTILQTQIELTDISQFLITRRWHAERIFKAVGNSRIALKKIFQSLCQTGNNYDGIIIPLVHLNKQFVERIHLIGVLIRQQFLHVVKEQNAILGLLNILVPLINKALIVNGIYHRQLRFLDNLMLIKIVTKNICQGRFSRTRLTYYNSIY